MKHGEQWTRRLKKALNCSVIHTSCIARPYAVRTLKRVAKTLIMPEDGIEAVLTLIQTAQRSIMLKMFTFDSPQIINAIVVAANRGVAVRVMLNPRRSSGARVNDATMETLCQAGVDARWTSPHFAVTHEKTMVLDENMVLIATFNFVDKNLTQTRDYGVVVDDAKTVQQVVECFEADWATHPYELPKHRALLVGNTNARKVMAEFIDTVERTLHVQHPKVSDMAIVDRLLAAARGARIHLLCGGRHGISVSDEMDTFSGLRTLERAGVQLRHQRGLRLHSKLLVADGHRALVGSMNIDRSAFDVRRELGVVFTDHRAVTALNHCFKRDWDEASVYDPPDPMFMDLVTGIDQMPGDADPGFIHK